jgi:hydroxyethylthiazole kinase
VSATSTVTPQDLADALTTLRGRPPLVQCLTNIVVAGWTANVLLAVGAAPAMVDNPHEAGEFAAIAGGVVGRQNAIRVHAARA